MEYQSVCLFVCSNFSKTAEPIELIFFSFPKIHWILFIVENLGVIQNIFHLLSSIYAEVQEEECRTYHCIIIFSFFIKQDHICIYISTLVILSYLILYHLILSYIILYYLISHIILLYFTSSFGPSLQRLKPLSGGEGCAPSTLLEVALTFRLRR